MIVEMLDLRTGLVYLEEVNPRRLDPVPVPVPARSRRRDKRISSRSFPIT